MTCTVFPMSELGLMQVYTGEGKGKTTAALGMAMRAWGHGMRVCVIQFMKRGEEYGEVEALRRMGGIELYQFGADHLIFKGKHCKEDMEMAERGLRMAMDVLRSDDFDMVILDEINVAMDFGLITTNEVLGVVRSRVSGVEVVLTGRNAPAEIMAEADLVTIMKMQKHPYESGVMARKGVEF
jgi:cob(I)alamin adenosyltransferase